MTKKVIIRMYYPNTALQLPSLEILPICYQCGAMANIPLNTLDIEVDPNEIDVELLGKTIEMITQNKI